MRVTKGFLYVAPRHIDSPLADPSNFNPIETAWRELRAQLAETAPEAPEKRFEFLVRLWNAVAWGRYDFLLHQCQNQEDRAQAVLKQQGGRTEY